MVFRHISIKEGKTVSQSELLGRMSCLLILHLYAIKHTYNLKSDALQEGIYRVEKWFYSLICQAE